MITPAIEAFLVRLADVAKRKKFALFSHQQEIRTVDEFLTVLDDKTTSRSNKCPMAACCDEIQPGCRNVAKERFENELGMSSREVVRVMHTADHSLDMGCHNPELRARLLAACNLTPAS